MASAALEMVRPLEKVTSSVIRREREQHFLPPRRFTGKISGHAAKLAFPLVRTGQSREARGNLRQECGEVNLRGSGNALVSPPSGHSWKKEWKPFPPSEHRGGGGGKGRPQTDLTCGRSQIISCAR